MTRPDPRQSILIVEDNDDDFEAVEAAMKEADGFAHSIKRCRTGHEAIAFLTASGHNAATDDVPMPCLIILDLNLPGLNGQAVLSHIKNDPNLRKIPVVVMTTSNDQQVVDECYHIGANTFIHKPMDLDTFFRIVAGLQDFWLKSALLPRVL